MEENQNHPPPQQEPSPSPKRPKMSSTTSDDDTTTTATANATATATATTTTTGDRKPKYKRRKIAIFFAYCGVGYQGMQKNPGAKTIEGELEEALFQSGAVPEIDHCKPQRYDWARSARTDKGVSAVGQVVSGRFYVEPPGFIERLNSKLPSQIRIFGYKRATPAFNAKKFCDRRRYLYLIPVFALDPCSHPDRETVLASLGSGNELTKCLECSERGRKVEGVMGKGNSALHVSNNNGNEIGFSEIKEDIPICNVVISNVESVGDIKINSDNGVSEIAIESSLLVPNDDTDVLKLEPEVLSSIDNIVNSNGESLDDTKMHSNNGVSEISIEVHNDNTTMLKLKEEVSGEDKLLKKSEFCYGEKEKERFNRILKYYEGTHNFHNFTTRIKAEDPAAQRFIVSFQANNTVNVDGIEFVKCEVIGQSFMLHQIRKMIGVAVAIMRNCAPESLIETALQKRVNINVPTAPEVGLYLDECFFTSYNTKWKDTHEELSMKDYAEEAEEFKLKYIYTHVASTEHKEGSVALWLHSLNHRNYPDLRVVENGVSTDKESVQVETTAE